MPRGRPSILTDEERAERIKENRIKSKAKSKNVTLDEDVAEKIRVYQDALSEHVGFRVTQSQALAHALRNVEFKS